MPLWIFLHTVWWILYLYWSAVSGLQGMHTFSCSAVVLKILHDSESPWGFVKLHLWDIPGEFLTQEVQVGSQEFTLLISSGCCCCCWSMLVHAGPRFEGLRLADAAVQFCKVFVLIYPSTSSMWECQLLWLGISLPINFSPTGGNVRYFLVVLILHFPN